MSEKIKKAVIPIAGLGTRFHPVTKSVPKALLPVVNKPLIHYAVAEAVGAGVEQVAFVASPGMDAVANYFKPDAELYRQLRNAGKEQAATNLERIDDMCQTTLIYQDEPLGLGHAILQARDWVGSSPFCVILPDDMVWGDISATKQLIQNYEELGGQFVGAVEVSDDQVPFKGIISGTAVSERVYQVDLLVEKPRPEEAPGNLSILGRYVLSPKIFQQLEGAQRGTGGEIQITDAIQATIGKLPLHAVEVQGRHVDVGNPQGMLMANLLYAGDDPAMNSEMPALGEAVSTLLRDEGAPNG